MDELVDEGVTHLFGNPGTTELPLMAALPGFPELNYVLGLQEGVVLAMADAYSRASGRLSAVNLHTSPGLGNAMGALYGSEITAQELREDFPEITRELLVEEFQADARQTYEAKEEEFGPGPEVDGVEQPLMRELAEMRYLWQVPHRLSGDKLTRLIGPPPATPLDDAVHESLRALFPLDGAKPRPVRQAGR
jgi:hypothetical protein